MISSYGTLCRRELSTNYITIGSSITLRYSFMSSSENISSFRSVAYYVVVVVVIVIIIATATYKTFNRKLVCGTAMLNESHVDELDTSGT